MAKERVSHAGAGTAAPQAPILAGPAWLAAYRRDWMRWTSVVMALLGTVDSLYLLWVKLSNVSLFCTGVGGCEAVNTSIYSEINGMPVSVLGVAGYLAIAALLVLESRSEALATYGPMAVFGMALTGTLYSAYLTYIELFVIHAVCPYCVVSAVLMVGIFILSVLRIARGPAEE